MKKFPFKITKDEVLNKPLIQVTYQNQEKLFYPEEILVIFLKKIKSYAIEYLQQEVKDIVATIPICFNYLQREAIKEVVYQSGLNIIYTLYSSTAAGIYYGFENEKKDSKIFLVFDLGVILNISLIFYEDGFYE